MSIFEIVCQKSCFKKKIIEIVNLILTRFACKANRDSKSGTETTPNLFQHQKFNGNLKILKRAFVRNHICGGKLFRLNLHEILITLYPELYFENRAYS